MNKTILEFKEKHHILVVDEIEYEIPQRTPALEEALREHDSIAKKMTEYEGNLNILSILFGKENAEKMFPKESANLDKLAKCVRIATELFMSEFNKMQAEETAKKVEALKPLFNAAESAAKTKQFVANKKK